ncbi:MAG: hypothetical protein SRB1_00775 [Desulfobacteraceae bacterium Eth-SRB1]|nr:MAG: hypothetical protein SRB1_00775 [Desulfobacteraceae bacterium Eth-SRB1]
MLLLTVFFSGDVLAEEQPLTKTVEAIGTGRLYAQNIAGAKNRAISDGLVAAMEKVLSDFLPVESLVQNFQLLNETFYEHTDQFVQNYRVLTEAMSGNAYRVIVQATISVDQVQTQLAAAGIVLGKKAMPRIMFFIAEQNPAGSLTKCWWKEDADIDKNASEIAMARAMRDAGLLIVDPGDIIQYIKYEDIRLKVDPDQLEAIDLGARFHADIVIVGKATVDMASNIMGAQIKSFKGTVAVSAYRTDTGEEIASTTQTAIAVNADAITGGRDALSSAGALAGDKLSSQIINAWRPEIKKLIMVEIIVEGTDHLANFVVFRNVLTDIPGVNNIQLREMKADEAIIGVNFRGGTKELADELMLKNYESFGINIYEISQNSLHIALVPDRDL